MLIPPSYERMNAHIYTDKPIYRPGDVMFIEVYVVDAFIKSPVGLLPTSQFFQNLYISMDITDPLDTTIHSDVALVQNGTAVYSY